MRFTFYAVIRYLFVPAVIEEFSKGPILLTRRTEIDDAGNIDDLLNEDSYSIFGRVNIPDLIEKCLLSLTVLDDKNLIQAYAGYSDCPNYSADTIDKVNWLTWVNSSFKIDDDSINYLNTLFLHYFVSSPDYEVDYAREVMRVFFNSIPDVQYCFLICPKDVALNEALITVFYPLDEKGANKSWRGFITERDSHLPLLHVREAKVEDNDDLVPLLNGQTEVLNEAYGDYYVAELIKAQDEVMKCLVAEVEGVAVGIMSLNAHFKLDLVASYFEMNAFNDLREPSRKDRYSIDSTETDVEETITSGVDLRGISLRRDIIKESTKMQNSVAYSHKVRENYSDDENQSIDTSYASLYDIIIKPKFIFLPRYKQSHRNSDLETDEKAESSPLITRFTKLISQMSHYKGTFYGKHSCICIELFAMDERFVSRSGDFLLKVFQTFPDKFYCIITVPHLVPEFPLIQRFTRLVPLMTKIIPQELYVFSAPGVLDTIMIDEASSADTESISLLLASVGTDAEMMIINLMQYLDCGVNEERRQMKSYVARVEDQVVGLAIIEKEEDMEYIRAHFNIEHFIVYSQHRREEHACLTHFVINPIFNHYSKHFLKEVLRLSGKTCLYYYRYPPLANKEFRFSVIMTAIKDMVPVSARRQISYNLESLGENGPTDRILADRKPFSLLHINRKLLLEPRKIMNARIVVVGASDTGISFLETLIFSSSLRFNNLTLVSANGLPGDKKSSSFAHQMLSHSYSYTDLDFIQMGLQNWVNVVIGHMTSINRREKVIVINKSSYIAYDFLILCTGTQYLVTCPPQMEPETGQVDMELNTPPGRRVMVMIPDTVFVINDLVDAEKVLFKIQKVIGPKNSIIIYGRTLDTFCCLNGLLCSGVKTKQIIFASPPGDNKLVAFNNAHIECKMLQMIQKTRKLNIVKEITLSHWVVASDGTLVKASFITDKGDTLSINCRALILYNHKGVDYDAFEAINCSALVFDRRLVIDANFRTNDPAIRAAGPLTKYQRIYYCQEWTHFRFNSKEIGRHLALSMMSIFDPSYDPPASQNTPVKITPTYTCPKVVAGMLPGRFYYLHVNKPKLDVPMAAEMANPHYGIVMISGSVDDEEKGYFRLHLDNNRVVETITCLHSKPILISNIIHLYGLHHKYLNNLMGRWYEGLITDLFSYFHEPWAMILYHDRFRDFREEVRILLAESMRLPVELVKGYQEDNIDSFIRKVLDENYMTEDRNKVLVTHAYKNWGLDRQIQQKLANYLHYNYYHLPMYAKPGMI